MATKRADLKAALSLDINAFERGLSKAMGSARTFAGKMTSTTGAALRSGMATAGKAAVVGGTAGMIAAAAGFGVSMVKAMDLETMEVQFQTLLGSAERAKTRIAELQRFADKTPFEMPEVVSASRQLEVLTQGALSTGSGLRLVGDVAAGTGMQFDEAAMWVGRLYDALQNNRPAGEAMMRLQEMGAMSGKVRGEIEKLQASGAGAQAWNVASAALGRYSGGMEKLSATFSGKMSTLNDAISGIFRSFGTPVMEAIKPAIDAATNMAASMAAGAKAFGEYIGTGIKLGMQMLKDGTLFDYIKERLTWAVATAGNYAVGMLQVIPNMIGAALKIGVMQVLPGLLQILTGSAMLIGAAITRSLDPAIESLASILSELPGIDIKTRDMFGVSKVEYAAKTAEQAGGQLLGKGLGNFGGAMMSSIEAMSKARADFKPSDVFSDTSNPALMRAMLIEDRAAKNMATRTKTTGFDLSFLSPKDPSRDSFRNQAPATGTGMGEGVEKFFEQVINLLKPVPAGA